MQLHVKGARYRGRSISFRSRPEKGGAAHLTLFTGSFRIAPVDGEPAVWHDIAGYLFHTPETAAAYALVKARRSIDTLLGPKPSLMDRMSQGWRER